MKHPAITAASVALLAGSLSTPIELSAASTMEEVIVTATRTDKVLLNSPYSVSLVTKAQITSKPADQISEYIDDLPGIYVSDAGQAGLKRIRIRGEEARRMAFLIDGQEFMDHREVGVPLLVDPASIQRIEVVKGPASVLYGPKAMGGVINVITDYTQSEPLSANLALSYDSSTAGQQIALGLGGVSGNWQWRLSALDNDQQERETPAGEIENTTYQSDGIAFSLKRVTTDSSMGLGYEDFNSSSDVYVEPEVRFSYPFVDFRIESPQRDREKIRFFWRKDPGGIIKNYEVNAYHQVSDREFNSYPSIQILPFLPRIDTSIYSNSELLSDAVNIQVNWDTGDSHQLITGIQFLKDRVEQFRLREVETGGVLTASEDFHDKAHSRTFAVYVQDDWKIDEHWSLLAGIRAYEVEGKLDKSSRFADNPGFDDTHTVASVSLVQSPMAGLSWRLTWSQGYIYPSLLNLSLGAYAGSRFVNPDPDLKPEESDTFEAGIRLADNRWTLDATLFSSRAENYIDHVFCQASDPCLTAADKIYKNIGQSNAHGVEVALSYALDSIDLYNNLTWMKRKKEYEGVSTYDSGIPEVAGQLGIIWSRDLAGNPFSLDLYSRHESSADEALLTGGVITTKKHDRWVTLNADMNVLFGDAYSVSVNLNNLTDRKYASATENLFAAKRHILIKFVGNF